MNDPERVSGSLYPNQRVRGSFVCIKAACARNLLIDAFIFEQNEIYFCLIFVLVGVT